ncbi:hypothetical protein [Streptomonospora sp. PA3]|nr:hypothetical protein [Streptomonospora sp. PA3]
MGPCWDQAHFEELVAELMAKAKAEGGATNSSGFDTNQLQISVK